MMNRIFIFVYIIMSTFLVSCGGNNAYNPFKKDKKADFTRIDWSDSLIDLGKIKMGDTIVVHFRFTNIGRKPLFIKEIETSCSCTSVSIPDSAYAPGTIGEIRAVLDTKKSVVGFISKAIRVVSNTDPEQKILRYKAEITGHKTGFGSK